MRKFFTLFTSIILMLSVSSSVFAESNVSTNPANEFAPSVISISQNYTQTVGENGQTVISSGVIPEGAETQTLYFYKESDVIQNKNSISSAEAENFSVVPSAVPYGELIISIIPSYRTIVSNWTATFLPGVQISYVNLQMFLQLSSLFVWTNERNALFTYTGPLTNFIANQATFSNITVDGYYRTRMTGSVTSVLQGVLTLSPANSATVEIPAAI
ncbi:hypothetical protein [Paenibacillus sp. S150]|uniref:hypothetical protein n=1 Tax=Paenibacillus sp. S150 TaxID=2749826 RepID=UPI001C571890|nr:hypothetical protein [Paenibacillus sp. S150]MBW4081241.1 hypothetical protein [Paenibacillus sp. S150]